MGGINDNRYEPVRTGTSYPQYDRYDRYAYKGVAYRLYPYRSLGRMVRAGTRLSKKCPRGVGSHCPTWPPRTETRRIFRRSPVMPAPSHKTSKRIARMLAMHRKGASSREIAEALDVAALTIRRWLRDSGCEPNGGHGPRDRRRRIPSKETDETLRAAAEARARIIGTVANGDAPKDRASAYEHKRARTAQLSALTDAVAHDVAMGRATPATLAGLMKLEQVSLLDLAALAPPPPPDPQNDIEAAATVRQRFALLVDTAEREARCKHCGKNPHGRD